MGMTDNQRYPRENDARRLPHAEEAALSRRGYCLLAALIGTLFCRLLIACDMPPHGTTSESSPTEKTMILPTTTLAPRPTLPPIDRNVTADLKTATFALG